MNILFAARLDPFKDPLTFVEAARLMPHHSFFLAGEGPLRNDCVRAASGNVTFYPWLPERELRDLRLKSDVFCQLSPVENVWAGSLIESMKMGMAVVCTDVGYTKQYLTDGFHLLLVPPRDPRAVAVAVRRLEDWKLRSYLGENARNFVSSNLSIARITAKVIGIAESIVEAE